MGSLDIKLIGNKFNRLTVLRQEGKTKAFKCLYVCQCDCGKEMVAVGSAILSGNTSSCGCLRNERAGAGAAKAATTHGLSGHPIYNIWIDIKRRCYDNRVDSYHNYGGRGITVCDEWRKNFKSFYDWCIKNDWERGMQIDRYPNKDGNYEPTNCRLATPKENCNNKRNNRNLTINGITKTASEWAEITGGNPSAISRRIRKGVKDNQALYGVGSGNKFN